MTPFGFTDVVTDAVSNRERGLILDIHNMPKYFFEIPTYTILKKKIPFSHNKVLNTPEISEIYVNVDKA